MRNNLEITIHEATVIDRINIDGEFQVESGDKKIDGAFISFAMPGEIISIEKLKYKRSSYYNFLKIIDNKNSERIDAICPHFSVCGGCSFQHMNENFYKNHKIKKLQKELPDYLDKIAEIIVIPGGLRRKANFEAIKKNDSVFLGFHRHNSRQIIDLKLCKIIRSEISNLLDDLRILLNKILSDLQKAEFFIVLGENGLDIGLEIQKVKIFPEELKIYVQEFCEKNDITRFIFRHGNKFETLYQNSSRSAPFIKFNNFEVRINPWVFMQTSKEAEQSMLAIIQSILNKIQNKKNVIDLFSGRGTYSLSLIDNFEFLKAVELSEDSILELERVSNLNGLPIEVSIRDLFSLPMTSLELSKFDLAIINPPRAGAENQIKELLASGIKNIIYVSCNPTTFARDLKILEEKYEVELIQPIDQFIWSNHLEVICWLRISMYHESKLSY